MVNNKAQIKIQQMAFMLIALTILFAIVALFSAGTKLGGFQPLQILQSFRVGQHMGEIELIVLT